MAPDTARPEHEGRPKGSALSVFLAFLRLGLTSFGGPIAHLGYFRAAFVTRWKWLGEEAFADLVAVCQILPGPTSSQVGFAIGLQRAGPLGGLAAFAGFTAPSALLMIAAALGASSLPADLRTRVFHGLVLVAVPIVAQAVIGMARTLCNTAATAALAIAALIALLLVQQAFMQPLVIALGALAGLLLPAREPAASQAAPAPRGPAFVCLGLFAALLVGLPLLHAITPAPGVAVADAFYRSGALVFGGGHVVLPLLEAETVGRGWISADNFLSGYGAAQALPGPLFAFAAYLGAASDTGLAPLAASLIALLAVFLPGLLLAAGVIPLWTSIRTHAWVSRLAAGASAAVVGVLAAALYRPVFVSAVLTPVDALIAITGLAALLLRAPVWLVVVSVTLLGAYSSAG
ncbi:MAG: chromate efflux transporter [Hyphomonadaceae bacterium]